MDFKSSLCKQLQIIFQNNIFRVYKNATTTTTTATGQILTSQKVQLYQNKAELVVMLTLNIFLITSSNLVLQASLFSH